MDAFTVSSSESSSLCSNAADRRHGTSAGDADNSGLHSLKEGSAAARTAFTGDGGAVDMSEQRRKAETASTTMRKVNVDYRQHLQQQNARTAALQRYKMLVRSSRLVPGDSPEKQTPTKKKETEKEEASATKIKSTTTTTRREKSHSRRRRSTGSGAAETREFSDDDGAAFDAVSEDSDGDNRGIDEEPDAGLDVAISAISNRRQPPTHCRSLSTTTSATIPSTASPVRPSPAKKSRRSSTTAVGVDRSPAAKEPAARRNEEDGKTASEKREKNTRKDGQQALESATTSSAASSAKKPSAAGAKSKSRRASAVVVKEEANAFQLPERCPYPVSYENEEAPDYQPPEQTEPVVKPVHPRRDMMRPNYEPVTEGIAFASGGGVRNSSSCKSRAVIAAALPAVVDADERKEEEEEVVAQTAETPVEQERNATKTVRLNEEDSGAPAPKEQDTAAASKDGPRPSSNKKRASTAVKEERVAIVGGSGTAFWVRPNSALYEQTASIAAKRKDHPPSKYEEEMGYARIDSGSSSALPTSATGSTSHGGSRPSRRMSARPEFDTRLAVRRSSVQDAGDGASRRTSVAIARGGGGALRGTDVASRSSRTSSAGSSPNHPTSQPQPQPHLNSPRGGATAASVKAGRRSSNFSHSSLSRESTTGDAFGSRVSDRQAQYFAKHCSRLASGRQSRDSSAPADLPSVPPSSARQSKSVKSSGYGRIDSSRTSTASASASVFSATGSGSKTKAKPVKSTKHRLSTSAAEVPVLGSPAAARRVSVAVAKESPHVDKKLLFDLDAQCSNTPGDRVAEEARRAAHATAEEGEMLSPMRTVPQATPQLSSAKKGRVGPSSTTITSRKASANGISSSKHVDPAAPANVSASLLVSTPLEFQLSSGPTRAAKDAHAQPLQAPDVEGTPNKSRRTERSRVASESPARDEHTAALLVGAGTALDDSSRAATEEAVRRHKAELSRARRVYEKAKANEAEGSGRARSGSLPSATESRTRMMTNEVVASMLQGIVHQSRRVLPCYLCAEMQSLGTYALHLDICGAKTQQLLQDNGGMSVEAEGLLRDMSRRETPGLASTDEEREAFSSDCYRCAKALLVPCVKCGHHMRVHDAREHELLCGRSYYENGKAGQRHREAVSRIERGAG